MTGQAASSRQGCCFRTLLAAAAMTIHSSPSAVVAFGPPIASQPRATIPLYASTTTTNALEDMSTGSNEWIMQWADQHDVWLHEGVQVDTIAHQQQQRGIYLAPGHQLSAGTPILKVPRNLLLTSNDDILQDDSVVQILKKQDMLEDWPELSLFLQLIGESKQVYLDWLPALPQESLSTSALAMTKHDLDLLPPFGYALGHRQRQRYKTFCQVATGNDMHDESKLQWAFDMVYSRSWRRPQEGENVADMVPMGDLFNHGVPADVTLKYTDDHVEFVLLKDVDTQKNKSPKQLYLSYGLESNPYRFLCLFGFVSQQPYVFCEILGTECFERSEMGISTEDGHLQPGVWHCVLASLLKDQKPQEYQTFVDWWTHHRHDDKANAMQHPLHKKYRLEVAMKIRSHLVPTCQQLDTVLFECRKQEQTNPSPTVSAILELNHLLMATFAMGVHVVTVVIQEEMELRKFGIKDDQNELELDLGDNDGEDEDGESEYQDQMYDDDEDDSESESEYQDWESEGEEEALDEDDEDSLQLLKADTFLQRKEAEAFFESEDEDEDMIE